jgi:pyridinium-3,5-biscarboxylic acid mononucleotide sulfurtransferase
MVQDKLAQLQALFKEMDRALIAYSGGIDSTLVAKIAQDVLGDRALAVTAVSPSAGGFGRCQNPGR